MDLYDAFAQRLPLQVICGLLAIPSIDHHAVGEWTAALSLATATPTPEARIGADRAITAFEEYTSALIAERRERPGDDLLSELIAVEESGDRLSKDELVAMVVQMLYAGHETTRNLIGNGLFTLLQHPAQLARLRREPALLSGRRRGDAALRAADPVRLARRAGRRRVGRRARAQGRPRAPRARVGQPRSRALPPPRRIRGRSHDERNLSFGWGMHFCLGAAIARMEGRVAFETLLARTAKIEWAGPPAVWAPATALRTLEAFPVELTPA